MERNGKKKKFKSVTILRECKGMVVGEGRLGYKELIICIVLLMALRFSSSLHSLDFFFIIKVVVFQGLFLGSICPSYNCS
jgi:hypothetical protein